MLQNDPNEGLAISWKRLENESNGLRKPIPEAVSGPTLAMRICVFEINEKTENRQKRLQEENEKLRNQIQEAVSVLVGSTCIPISQQFVAQIMQMAATLHEASECDEFKDKIPEWPIWDAV